MASAEVFYLTDNNLKTTDSPFIQKNSIVDTSILTADLLNTEAIMFDDAFNIKNDATEGSLEESASFSDSQESECKICQ